MASFVERFDLCTEQQAKQAEAIAQQIQQDDRIELVRFVFPDQHGLLRGKTLVASAAVSALREGVNMTTTLLAKDTSHATVFPVFSAGGGFEFDGMQGGADFVMVEDPATFQIHPWMPKTAIVLVDIFITDGSS